MFGSKRREQRRFDSAATCYKMRQRMISIGDDYEIENDQGERVFKLDGKALRIRKTILFKDMDGHELCKIQERVLHLRDSMEIEGPDGNRMAMVHKAMIAPLPRAADCEARVCPGPARPREHRGSRVHDRT